MSEILIAQACKSCATFCHCRINLHRKECPARCGRCDTFCACREQPPRAGLREDERNPRTVEEIESVLWNADAAPGSHPGG
jgi:hypothetical protein